MIAHLRRKRKNPADLTFRTLEAYFYDSDPFVLNWVFPIDITPFLETNPLHQRNIPLVRRDLERWRAKGF